MKLGEIKARLAVLAGRLETRMVVRADQGRTRTPTADETRSIAEEVLVLAGAIRKHGKLPAVVGEKIIRAEGDANHVIWDSGAPSWSRRCLVRSVTNLADAIPDEGERVKANQEEWDTGFSHVPRPFFAWCDGAVVEADGANEPPKGGKDDADYKLEIASLRRDNAALGRTIADMADNHIVIQNVNEALATRVEAHERLVASLRRLASIGSFHTALADLQAILRQLNGG